MLAALLLFTALAAQDETPELELTPQCEEHAVRVRTGLSAGAIVVGAVAGVTGAAFAIVGGALGWFALVNLGVGGAESQRFGALFAILSAPAWGLALAFTVGGATLGSAGVVLLARALTTDGC